MFSRNLTWCWVMVAHDQFWHSMDLFTMSVIGEALALSVKRANDRLPPGHRCDDALVQWDQFSEDWRPMLRNRPGAVTVGMTRLALWYACKKAGWPVLWTVLAGVVMFSCAQLLRPASPPNPGRADDAVHAPPTATPPHPNNWDDTLSGLIHEVLRDVWAVLANVLVGAGVFSLVLFVASLLGPVVVLLIEPALFRCEEVTRGALFRCAEAYERLYEKRAARVAQREAELAEEAARRAEAERAARRAAKKAQRRSKKIGVAMHGFGAPLVAGIVEEEGEQGEEGEDGEDGEEGEDGEDGEEAESEEATEAGEAGEAGKAGEAGEAGEADGTDGSSVVTDVSDLAVASADDDDADDAAADNPLASEWHAVAPRRARRPRWDDAQRVYVSSLTFEALRAHEGKRFLRPETEWDDADDAPSERMSVAASAAKSVAASTRTNTTTKIQRDLRITGHAHERAAEPTRAIDYDDPQFARDLRDGVRVRTADKSGEPSCKVIGKKYKIWLELDGKTVKSAAPLGS